MNDPSKQKAGSSGFEILHFGEEREPVVVIDDFSSDPQRLRDLARRAQYQPGGNHYPGHRAPAPASYLGERMEMLRTVLTDVFGAARGADLGSCSFSLVTTLPEHLTPIQRLPHFDGADPSILAVLHYLCGPEEGGTSFYRHRATGFETISARRLSPYDAALKAEVKQAGLPPASYFSGSTEQFEQIGRVDAAFNRLVIYRGWRLHSGEIPRANEIGKPGAEPRLTINTFLQARQTAHLT